MLGTGKHWQQTINGITKIKTGRIGEELQTLGNNYKYWLTLWGSGEIFGNQLQTLAKHCGTKTNIGEELQTLSSGETLGSTTNIGEHWGALQTLGARSLFLFKVHTAISVRLSLSLSRFPKDVQC